MSKTKTSFYELTLDIFAVVWSLVYSGLIWWPNRYLPYFYDNISGIILVAEKVQNSGIWESLPQSGNLLFLNFFSFIYAAYFSVIKNSLLNTHILILPFLPIFLISLYFLAKSRLNHFYSMAVLILVSLMPPLVTEYANVYTSLPSASLLIASAAFLSASRVKTGMFTYLLSTLINPFYLIYLPALFFLNRKAKIFLAVPVIGVIAWLSYLSVLHQTKISPSWLISVMPDMMFYPKLSLLDNIIAFLTNQYRWLWLVVILLSIGNCLISSSKRPGIRISAFQRISLASALIGLIALSVTGIFAERFFLPEITVYALFTIWSISKLGINSLIVNSANRKLLVIMLLIFTQSFSWRHQASQESEYDFNPPQDLGFLDMIRSLRELSATIQVYGPNAEVYGGLPETLILTQTHFNYALSPINITSCDNFKFNPDVLQFVIIHPYSSQQIPCRLLMDQQKLLPLARMDNNGKWIELYQVSEKINKT